MAVTYTPEIYVDYQPGDEGVVVYIKRPDNRGFIGVYVADGFDDGFATNSVVPEDLATCSARKVHA